MPVPKITKMSNPDHFGGATVKAKRPTIQIRAGHSSTVQHQLLVNSVPCDLTQYGFSTTDPADEDDPPPNLVARIGELASFTACADTPVAVTSASTGAVEFDVPDAVTNQAGLWLIEFSVITADEKRHFISDAYLYVERNVSTTDPVGLPTFAEVRLYLRDYAQENELLDAVDFDGSEITMAADMCVCEWNEADPWDGPRYATDSFPFRARWLRGIISHLYQIAADHYARNQMQKDGGQIAYDDKAKAEMYQKKAIMYRQEWIEFITSRKTVLAAQAGFFTIPGCAGLP